MTVMRAETHVHSELSYDESWTLAGLAQLFRRLGTEAFFMTEHDIGFDRTCYDDCSAACAGALVHGTMLVVGIGYFCPKYHVHILTWRLGLFPAEHRTISETLEAVRAEGGMAVFGHPTRRNVSRNFDPSWLPLLDGIGFWNRQTDRILPLASARDLKPRRARSHFGVDFNCLKRHYSLDMLIPDGAPGASPEQLLATTMAARPPVCARGFVGALTVTDGTLQDEAHRQNRRAKTLRCGLRRLKLRFWPD